MYDESNPFHAGLKLTWLEAIAIDPTMNGNTLKVAVAISQRVKRDGIAKTASQLWIAKRIGITERAVRNCIGRLCRAGYLERLSAGGRTADGRGRAAEWRLVIPEKKSSSLSKMISAAVMRNSASGNATSESPEAAFRKSGSGVPPFPYSSNNFLTRAKAPESEPVSPSVLCGPWQAIKEALSRRQGLGPNKVRVWLDPLQVESCAEGVLKLTSAQKFHARQVAQQFERLILDIWREIDPSARRVSVEYKAPQQEGNNLVDF